MNLRLTLLGFAAILAGAPAGIDAAPASKPAPKKLVARKPPIEKAPGDAMIAAYFKEETARLRDRCLTDVAGLDDWKTKRVEYRRQLFEMLGLDPLPEKGDLKATVTGRVEHDEFIVEKIHFQSRPGLYVTGNLYIPKKLEKPAPTILYACGHALVEKDGVRYGNKTGYLHHGCWFARHGYVCFTIDTVQLGEIAGIHHGTFREKMWWWNCRGYTPAGVEAWNCIRALDYLQTRKEVDSERIGMTGRSGGGAYTWFAAALDERIKVVVPVAGITDLENHVVDGCITGHCDCMFPVNTYCWDYPLLAALIAPRPLLITNSDKDKIFPLDGVIRVHTKVRDVYQLYGADANLGLQISEGPHKDTQELQVAAFSWFNRFLKNDPFVIEKAAVKLFEPEQLKVFTELPADATNARIHESFVAKAPEPAVPSSEQWQRTRDGWMNALRTKSFAGWPAEDAQPLDLKLIYDEEHEGLRFRKFEYTSQHPIRLPLFVVSASGKDGSDRVVLHVPGPAEWDAWAASVRKVFNPGTSSPASQPASGDFGTYRQAVIDSGVVHMYAPPRGIGPTAWTQAEPDQTHLLRRFMLLGQTADGMRVWDVRRAVQAARTIPNLSESSLRIEAAGPMAGVALYASLFEPEVAGLDLADLPASHDRGPIFLNVLRFLDVPQALAMAVERTEVSLRGTPREASAYASSVAAELGWPKGRMNTQD